MTGFLSAIIGLLSLLLAWFFGKYRKAEGEAEKAQRSAREQSAKVAEARRAEAVARTQATLARDAAGIVSDLSRKEAERVTSREDLIKQMDNSEQTVMELARLIAKKAEDRINGK